MKLRAILFCLALGLVLLLASGPVQAAQVSQSNQAPGGTIAPEPAEEPADVAWKDQVDCILTGPAQVQGYRVRCTGATRLDAQIADCCISGDHWQLKVKNWDNRPNTAVTTSPGPANVFGVAARVYNYGGTAANPGNIDAYVQCTYLHGVDVFAAQAFIVLNSDGVCTVAADVIRSRIDRAP